MILALAATSAEASPPLDPTVQILLTIFGAAIVTAGAGFVGAWLQSKRDHDRWVREKRLDAYIAYLQLNINRWDILDDFEKLTARQEQADAKQTLLESTEGDTRTVEERVEWLAEIDAAKSEREAMQVEYGELAARLREGLEAVKLQMPAFSLLGPGSVSSLAGKLGLGQTATSLGQHIDAIETVMREALNIKD